ncbi:sigma-70 family RNA polymerase sigma factor [Achromobacter arsenitoxydans]|uniref:ECF subfamily RNA polymerase sigma-24 subunit n=1 Tax=Achromobacter arsenitoxydans SY8 TaxID=477184 RepID=H0F2D9_9BURK|nr:sigma-70 family RNA polymerase sigma factor [Achromobacter arsenitoxydans]EHK67550.1 ECF subfamily RNA polymerase sigma-24 subunit [Achromobacter arsenitoxydans SY8]
MGNEVPATSIPLPRFVPPTPPDDDAFDHDAALLACAQGDRDALRRIYERESRYLLGVALRIVRDRAAAEDVLHDAFVSIWSRASSFDARRGAGRGWIYSVVRHAALNRMRDGVHETVLDEPAAAHHETQAALAAWSDNGDELTRQAALGRLGQCLEELEPTRRACVLHAYVDGCTHGEIAKRMQAPLGTVKAWIQRGLRALRECMQ